jgi:Protein of unknown function (DUF3435)
MRAATRMSRWSEARRLRELTTKQKASVDQDPKVQELIQRRNHFKRHVVSPIEPSKGTPDYNKIQKSKQDVIDATKRGTYALLKAVRQAFDDEQAETDIERQLWGTLGESGHSRWVDFLVLLHRTLYFFRFCR